MPEQNKQTTAEQIHEASLSLLQEPGVRVEHEEILGLLKSNGANPGSGSQDVRLPREMVEEFLGQAPEEVVLTNRFGEETILSSRSEPVFWSVPGMGFCHRGEHRAFASDDMAAMARLLDQLPNVQTVFGMSLDDIPPPARDVVGLRIMAENTSKHIRVLCFAPQSMEVMLEMKSVIGEHPWFSVGFTAHGPLRWTNLALEVFRLTAGRGIPATVNGEPMAGTSAPVTLEGTAAVGNAEILAGIVINQILEPGRPCIYNFGLAHTFDMKTAIAVTGGPENALFAQISAMMGRFYCLPSCSWVSTEAMCPDSQAALEKMFGFQTHVQSGVSCIWGVGQLESELTISPGQAVIDNEMIEYAKRYHRGIEVSEEKLALDVTRSVGIAGSFLDHEHTLTHFRDELFEPSLLFRKRRSDWNAEGMKRLDERAEEIADDLMARPVDNGLSDEQRIELGRLASKRLREVSIPKML
ncbi:MAG: trimethylamine methyltransferase family protein [Planctomycetota bacterium]|jgi:trimethylamine--corrinoid protein Co-methyltransferase|nr:trimethylamine methyltransferase family protein [Planctomycetota bacterium]MDP7248713.1 trimethylamine methyltransferase family protein [Planctomycetota bacterium]